MPKINDQYDIGEAFEAIENELIASMIRNLRRHKQEETDEKKQWSMWQAEQLKALEKYKKLNQKKYGQKFKDINKKIQALISIARSEGEMDQEIAILEAIKKGFPAKRISKGAAAEFFKLNERKLEALIKATMDDMKKAETAVLRMANDQYRKVIYNAQVYANTGAGTYEKAVDMATKDFLAAGLNCVEYANGARHTLSDYADMAIRTACKRAYLQGEGVKRQEWGIHTVIVNKSGTPCPKCLPFCGKVLIDDVWSGGSWKDGSYPLMSTAVAHGLYHPRCKDSHTTYFPGISTADDTWTKEELEAIGLNAKKEARQQYAERQEKRFGRLAEHSLDAENQKRYTARREEWKRRRAAEAEPKTTADINKNGTKKLVQAYEDKRIMNNLNLSPANAFVDKMPDIIKADYGVLDFDVAKGFNDTITELIDEYNTSLQKVVTMEKAEAYFLKGVPASTSMNYNVYSAEMRVNQIILKDRDVYVERVKKAIKKGQFPDIPDELAEKYVPTHEFAHTLFNTQDKIPAKKNWTGMDFGNIRKSRSEIKKLYQSYIDEMGRLKDEKNILYKKVFDGSISNDEFDRLRKVESDIKKIRISNYAEKDADEFMAEAFTDAKLGTAPSEYSKKVLELINKYFGKSVAKGTGSGIMELTRNMSNGLRRSPLHILDTKEIQSIVMDAKEIGIPIDILKFNSGNQTGFCDRYGIINIRGDVLPDMESNNLRDRLSQRAVLAHEYYGHYKSHPSKFRVGDWRDEFRASYKAAINTPFLSDEERRMLMLDAYDRAKEAGVTVKYNRTARRMIYGYND